ncbi:PIN domain-containing protein [Haloglomus litoreum]|uniref:PIN domain-containing protein n=1 Tax=Haloglomus litoreum TaxID=3034026 RepID=UPI0023E81702|nr:PIN domain-containing protein [Haloglomus sp. DT116]
MILDTNFLGALKDRHPGALAKAEELETSGVPLRVPTIVWFELFIPVGHTNRQQYRLEDQRAYRRLISSRPTVDLTQSIAKRAGVLEGTHRRSDSKPALGPADAIVASTALEVNEPVVSDDDDFDHVDGLTRVGY